MSDHDQCKHGNAGAQCLRCIAENAYAPTTSLPFIPIPTYHTPDRTKELEARLSDANEQIHSLMKHEVEWQERIDTLTGERDTLLKLTEDAINELERLTSLLHAVLEGDAEWVPSHKN